MKTILLSTVWAFVAGTILFTALSPTGGVLFHDPVSALGLGLIGLGLCLEVRKAQAGPFRAG